MKKSNPFNVKNTILAIATAGILSVGSLLSSIAWTTLALTASVATLSYSSAVYADGPKEARIKHCPTIPKKGISVGVYFKSGLGNTRNSSCLYIVPEDFNCKTLRKGCRRVTDHGLNGISFDSACLCPAVSGLSKAEKPEPK